MRETTDGSIRLEVDQWGPKHAVSVFFHDSVLEQEVRKVANKRDGFVLIPHPGQLLMMASLRDAITGNDWTANPAALKGRAVEEDQIIFAPISWPGMRESYLLRIVIFDADWVERLADAALIDRIVAVDPVIPISHEMAARDRARLAAGTAKEKGGRGDMAGADQVCETTCLRAGRLAASPSRRKRRAF